MRKKKRSNSSNNIDNNIISNILVLVLLTFAILSIPYFLTSSDLSSNIYVDHSNVTSSYTTSSDYLQGNLKIKFDSLDYIPSNSYLRVDYGNQSKFIDFDTYLDQNSFSITSANYDVSGHSLGNGSAYTLKKYKILKPFFNVDVILINTNDENLTTIFNANISFDSGAIFNNSKLCFTIPLKINNSNISNLTNNDTMNYCYDFDDFDIVINSDKIESISYIVANNRLYINTNYTQKVEYYESDFDEFNDVTVDVDIGSLFVPVSDLNDKDQFLIYYAFENYSQLLLNSTIFIDQIINESNLSDSFVNASLNLSSNQSVIVNLNNSILNHANISLNTTLDFPIIESELNFSLINLNLTLDNNITMNFTSNITNLTINQSTDNISLNISSNLTLLNNTNLNISVFNDNISSLFAKSSVIINEDVEWQKEINLSMINASQISLLIPESSYNVSVFASQDQTIESISLNQTNITLDDYVAQISNNILDKSKYYDGSNEVIKDITSKQKSKDKSKDKTKSVELSTNNLSDAKQKIKSNNLIDSNKAKLVQINDLENKTKAIINYKTKGPVTIVENLSNSKIKFTVSSDIHYSNITSYYNLENEMTQNNAEKSIKISHIVNNTKQTVSTMRFVDTNNNSLIDRVEWIVPHLSNQTYEIEFLILNVHSTPAVGQHWRINFNTSGTANLSISGDDGTVLGQDLAFDTLKCGDAIVNASYFSNLIFVQDYSCDSYTSILSLLELKPGSHTVKFDYGGLTDYAYNRAGQLNCTVRTTGCNAHETQVIRLSNYTNAHAELPNMSSSDYNYSVCCWDEGYEINITTNFSSGDALFLSLNKTSNSHVEDKSQSNPDYPYSIYLSSTESTFSTGVVTGMTCQAAGYQSCIVKLNNVSNSHLASCTDTDSDYGNLMCGSINNNAPTATLNYPATNSLKTSSFNFSYNASDPDGIGDITSCKLYTNNGSGYVVYNDNTNVLATNNIVTYTVAQNTEYNLLWYVNCTDLGNDFIVAGIRNLTVDAKSPSLSFDSKYPADLDTFNLFTQGLMNITYNISDLSGLNTNSISLYHKTNDSTDDITFYENGTIGANGYYTTVVSKTNIGNNQWKFRLSDNMVYPATYLINEGTLVNTAHSAYLLDLANEVIKMKIFNVSNAKQYSFLEVMANSSSLSGTKAMDVYYCNSSYVSGSVDTNNNCYLFYQVPAQTQYDHSHGANSKHIVIPFAINITTGTIGTIKITPTSYFVFRGSTSNKAWNIWYINNIARPDTIQTSTNKGGSWSNFAGTIDSHLHQYDGSETFYYYACANDTLGNQKCGTQRSDLIELGGLAPTSPFVFNPSELSGYNNLVQINYTAAASPNGYAINYYNISLLNSSFGLTQFLTQTTDLNHTFSSTSFTQGYYYIQVEACDINGLCSSGFSKMFSIDRSPPTYSDLSVQPPSPTTYVESGKYTFNVTWQDNLNVTDVIFEFDGTNYTYSQNQINKSGFMYFKDLYGLSRNTFDYRWYASDAASNINTTNLLNYTVQNEKTNLTCRVVLGSCNINETAILRLSNYTNAHVQLLNQSGYGYTLCCDSGVSTVDLSVNYSSAGTGDLLTRLTAQDNAHVQDKTQSGYLYPIYLQSSIGNFSVDIVTGTTCQAAGYDTCIMTISNATNAHVASCDNTPYDRRICGSVSNTRPTVTLTSPSDNSYTKTNFNFTYNVNSPDGIQFIDHCALYVNKSSSPGYVLYDNNTNVISTGNKVTYNVSASESQSIDWYVNCSTTSNTYSLSSTWNVIVDTTLPSVSGLTSSAVNDRAQYDDSVTFTVTVTDDYLSTVKIGGTTYFTASQANSTWSLSKTPSQLGCVIDQNCTITANATDIVGNSNIDTYNLYVYNNSAPTTPILDYPANSGSIIDRVVTLIWNNSVDLEGDSISYDLLLDDDNDFSSPIIDAKNITEGLTQTTYQTPLLNINTPYYWKVLAHDYELSSSYSSTYSFTILKLISIAITNSDVNFGTLAANDQKNTSSAGMTPIILENDGNSIANVTISAQDLFSTASNPSGYYLYSVSPNEAGSFNETLSQIVYANMPNVSNSELAIAYLDWNNSKDSSKVNIKVIVPADETSGAKEGTIYFVASG